MAIQSRLCLVALGVIALPATALAQAETRPPALQAALDAAASGPVYAYEMIFDDGEVRAEGIVDATRPVGQRITVTNPAKEDWPEGFADDIADIDENADGDIWCASFGEHVPETVELVEETPDQAIYTFQPVPEADADGAERKVFNNLVGEITVDKEDPAILAFAMRAPKSFKPAMVARINTFDMAVSCARAPDGRTFVEEMQMVVAGSAMGQSFEDTVRRSILNLMPAAGDGD